MKQVIRCHCLTIAKKLRMDVRLIFDDRTTPEFVSSREGTKTTSLTLFPTVTLTILRPREVDENGKYQQGEWNRNDMLGMTKFNLPIFISELEGIQKDLKIPKLYSYQGKRLEINESLSEKIRRVFIIGNFTIELSAVVVIKPDESTGEDVRLEGIKMKFNNEQSAVVLTLNELDSLVWNMNHMELDTLAMMMFLNYYKKNNHPTSFDVNGEMGPKPNVDIKPLRNPFESPEDELP